MKSWNFPKTHDQWVGVLEQYKYVFVVIVVGLILLFIPISSNEEDIFLQENTKELFQLSAFEDHLSQHLSLIDGAGTTRVVLTLKNDGQTVYAQDTQQENQGRTMIETVTIGTGSNQQVVEVQQNYPDFQGALIICEGGGSPKVQLELIQAVSALTGLRSDHITVCKSK